MDIPQMYENSIVIHLKHVDNTCPICLKQIDLVTRIRLIYYYQTNYEYIITMNILYTVI